jgi:hypothetical protein
MSFAAIRHPGVRRLAGAFAVAVALGWTGGEAARAAVQAAEIAAVLPAAARTGETVTILGRGFGALNVTVSVGGRAATVLSATGDRIVIRVPNDVAPGRTTLTVVNPGGRVGTVAFEMLEGILLPGNGSALALDAIFDLPPIGVDGSKIQGGLIMTRLELRLTTDATVGQLNDALIRVEGGIVSMTHGAPWATIAVPLRQTQAELDSLVAILNSLPGIGLAKLALTEQPQQLFRSATADNVAAIRHLLASRFPAAWNAAPGDFGSPSACAGPAVPLIVADGFASTFEGSDRLPPFRLTAAPPPNSDPEHLDHGWNVALVAAKNVVGANPFASSKCIDLRLVQVEGSTVIQVTAAILANLPPGKAIVNYSLGFNSSCTDNVCQPPTDHLQTALGRADNAFSWKWNTRSRWSDFLVIAAAGNWLQKQSTAIYAGMGDSRYNSVMTISQLDDTRFDWMTDGVLWNPSPLFSPLGFTSLVAPPDERQRLVNALTDAHLTASDAIADNVIVVGSMRPQSPESVLTQHVTPEQLSESAFSNTHPDVRAAGEDVFGDADLTGTSFAAPQVAGLAAYLWQVSPDLRSRRAAVTKQAIVANARNGVIDAYASVLSLDPAALPTPATSPIRRTLLDIDGDGAFTDFDLDAHLRWLYFVDPNTNELTYAVRPAVPADFTRFDLNGDGFTTAGARRERFDLDRVGSTQYGPTVYSVVTQTIEDAAVRFDEEALTDVEILCYYAYSPMYQGIPKDRKEMLAGRCGLSIEPTQVTLQAGQTQQFKAHVPGNGAVNWSATCGTIDSTGLYKAGSAAGTCKVRATSVVNTDSSAEATVTITGASSALYVTFARAATGPESDFFCPPGPTTEPGDPEDNYWTRTPFGLNREGLSSPPPNVGRLNQLSGAVQPGSFPFQIGPLAGTATVKANCRYINGFPNTAEAVTTVSAAGNSVNLQVYLSATNRYGFGPTAVGRADVSIPADGFLDVTINQSWIKVLRSSSGGEIRMSVSGLFGGYGCLFNPSPSGPPQTQCSGNSHIPVTRGERVLMTVIVFTNGEGSGTPMTVTYTQGSQ